MRLIDYPRRNKRGVRRWLPSWKLVLGTSATLVAGMVAGFFVAVATVQIPKPNEDAVQQATIFTYADGSSQITHVGTNRRPVSFDQIPLVVRQAVLAAEDRTFYSDPGVSPMGLLRALKNDLTSSGGNLQGGSTITQQFVKNYYLTQQQTLGRKLNEVLVAIKLDQVESKDAILVDYLNTIYFARGAYGIESASRAYFGVDVSQLTDPAKAAYIAAVIQSPYYYATADKDPKAAKALQDRWNYVLDGMVAEHELSTQQRASLQFPTPVKYEPDDMGGMNGYMVDAAMQNLDRLHEKDPSVPDSNTVARGGYTVVTTFRQDYMQAAKKAVDDRMSTLDPNKPQDRNVHIGMASVDDRTGAVLGFYGGPDYLKQGFNDAFSAAGPLGSDVEKVLGSVVPANHYEDAGIDFIPGTKALATTPLRAAAAMSSMANGYQYNQPYEVSEIRQNGEVIWRAQPQTENFWGGDGTIEPVRQFTPFKNAVRGADVPKWWAWSMLDFNGVTTAANMFATPPDGKGNRALLGMTGGYEANLDAALYSYVSAVQK
ncbi:transglycosylase domain-containing protein [Kutzneria kofuensis]|uniref:Membrane peptidoglycan carboxypeptidase n=1 Tax=Kutzneria kofuensis TaxID=103725 RepID=A0A7W9KKK2_9PSEU|nr:transglycosylase domain-containing protein [Kutzneria kofuensis]MBB5894240.1 membrane peptidoglycan carboxypeptidase [Kutzneria kofuensis]